MSESEGRVHERDPKAARILALHAEHRQGLHSVPLAECIQCTFDGLVRSGKDDPAPLSDPDSA